MYRDRMEGDGAGGKAGRGGRVGAVVGGTDVAVGGTEVAVSVAAGMVGATVAGVGDAVSVTAGTVGAGDRVAMVGKAGDTVLQAIPASRTTNPPSKILNRRERIRTPL
jgi:hypothetical protein